MGTLWYALFRGELCRIRRGWLGRLHCETWRNGFWVPGPNLAEVDFTGRAIAESEAQEWIRIHFREKKIKPVLKQ